MTLVCSAIVAGLVFSVVKGGLIDDSYITLSYARNLATHLRWGMFEEEIANSATSPFNVVVLGAVTWLLHLVIGSQPMVALGVVFVAANAVLAETLRRVALTFGFPGWTGILGAALLLFNPLLLSSVGLEMTLAATLLSLALHAAVRGRPCAFGAVSGLLVLTRVDLGIVALFLFVGTRSLWRGWWRIAVSGAALTLPWYAFSWWTLGSAVPDTLLIKQMQDYWGERVFSNGLQSYLAVFPTATALSLAAPALALIVLSLWLVLHTFRTDTRGVGTAAFLGIGGVAHYFAYTLLGVPPYHWYYAPSIVALSISLVLLLPAFAGMGRLVLAASGTGVVVAGVVCLVSQGMPWREAPINTNGATSAEYARMGRELGRLVGDATVSSPGEIGALAYFCRCVIVDEFSDRGYLPDKIEHRLRGAGPIGRWLIETNYAHFDRSVQPRAVDFDLRRVDGFGPDPLWNGDSAYHEPAHFVLERR